MRACGECDLSELVAMTVICWYGEFTLTDITRGDTRHEENNYWSAAFDVLLCDDSSEARRDIFRRLIDKQCSAAGLDGNRLLSGHDEFSPY